MMDARGRLDLLLHGLIEAAWKRHIDPQLRFPVWDRGMGNFVQGAIQRSGIPTAPVQSVQVGNLTLPLAACEYFAQCIGLLAPPAPREVPRGRK